MTTFTSDDRKAAYDPGMGCVTPSSANGMEEPDLVAEAPYHPGYEDAVVYPTVIVDSGASVMTLGDYIEQENREEMLRDQLHILNEEIKRLTDENMKLKREIDNLMDGRC